MAACCFWRHGSVMVFVVVDEGTEVMTGPGSARMGKMSSGEPRTRDMTLSNRMFWRENSSWRTADVRTGMLRR